MEGITPACPMSVEHVLLQSAKISDMPDGGQTLGRNIILIVSAQSKNI